ncbi:hypothetical protein N7G274_008597 [Stereocaulon virgatum]|uniref:Protein kinase domain-containing protein n=1 Tax=Stereocaulon virgatum TaxID=373712 RepID=A0ABR4A0G0_9LECA
MEDTPQMSCRAGWQALGSVSLMERFSSRVSLSEIKGLRMTHGFLAFLTTAQALRVEFLPITWQSARKEIGKGGTSVINEALVNRQISFAFKRVRDDEKFEKSKGEIFQSLMDEITVLSHPWIRGHPNIAQLQGVCWDISDGNVWPVLVFEKSQFGDLFEFARLPVGRELNLNERLELCIGIGKAVVHMHSRGIVHGDLKPQNILIFKDHTGTYTAKVTDFGYSSQYADDENTIGMPISWPWNAPEHTRLNQRWTPSEARKMDYFSFGMLCLWVLFEKSLSGATTLLENTGFESSSMPLRFDREQSIAVLEEFRREERLTSLARQLLEAERCLSNEKKYPIGEFFSSILNQNPEKRDVNIGGLFDVSSQSRTESPPFSREFEEMEPIASDTEFKIETSIFEFYACDYRVRSHIRTRLEEKFCSVPESFSAIQNRNSAFQVALCYKLGFGVKKDDHKSMEALHSSGQTEIDIQETLNRCNEKYNRKYQSLDVGNLYKKGHMPFLDFGVYYLEQNKLEEAEMRLIQEIKDLELSLGHKSNITLSVKCALSSIWVLQKRWEDAEKLQVDILQTSMKMGMSPQHPSLLAAINNLAFIFQNLGDWKNAEKLQLNLMEANSKALDAGHLFSLANVGNLAKGYRDQKRWDDAEKLELKAVEMCIDLLGIDHPDTLVSQAELAWTYKEQGRWEDAEKLNIQVLEISARVMGGEHPFTLAAMASMAYTVAVQGRWEEAEKLGEQVTEGRENTLGAEHPDTLASKDILAYMVTQSNAVKRKQFELMENDSELQEKG